MSYQMKIENVTKNRSNKNLYSKNLLEYFRKSATYLSSNDRLICNMIVCPSAIKHEFFIKEPAGHGRSRPPSTSLDIILQARFTWKMLYFLDILQK